MIFEKIKYFIWLRLKIIRKLKKQSMLKILKKKMNDVKYMKGGIEKIEGFLINYNNGPNFYIQYKDVFIQQIYKFDSLRNSPLIIDGGSNIGLSLLYFKSIYSSSKIIAFEPDPAIFSLLKNNISNNKLKDISVYNIALGKENQNSHFEQDGKAGGHLDNSKESIEVKMKVLSDYINEPIDFLKLNIEGQEYEVIREIHKNKKIEKIDQMVIEYHGFPNLNQTLGEILKILEASNFRYLIHDFDYETCKTTKPPFRLKNDDKWYCLIYAKNKKSPFNHNLI